jgi:hypothetical protein
MLGARVGWPGLSRTVEHLCLSLPAQILLSCRFCVLGESVEGTDGAAKAIRARS